MSFIKVKANGKEYEIESPMSVAQFIQAFGFNPQRCVVELNGKAMRYADFCSILLNNGDSLEIMSVVAGG